MLWIKFICTLITKIADYKMRSSSCSETSHDSIDGLTNRLRPSTSRWFTIEPAIILYRLASGASTPLQIQYVNDRLLHDLVTNATDPCHAENQQLDTVREHGAAWLSYMTAASIIPALLTTLLIGNYSDKTGRKHALLPSLVGDLLRLFVATIAIAYRLPLFVFYLANFIHGLLGGSAVFLTASFCYTADVTTDADRTTRVLVTELCACAGQTAAQMAVGEAIGRHGYLYPAVALFAVQVVNLAYILFILPEPLYTLPNAALLQCDGITDCCQLCIGGRRCTTHGHGIDSLGGLGLRLGLALTACISAAAVVDGDTLVTLFLASRPLCWDPPLVGYYGGAALAVRAICSLVLFKLLTGRVPEVLLVAGGLVSNAAYDVAIGLASQTRGVFIAPIVGFGSQIMLPVVRVVTSKLVSDDKQGSLLASHAWVSMLGGLVGALVFNPIYGATPAFPGLVFLVAAFSHVVPLGLTVMLYLFEKTHKFNEETQLLLGRDRHQQGSHHDYTQPDRLPLD